MTEAPSSLSIVAANLRRMIESSQLSRRAWALERELDVKLIERITKGSNDITLGKLEEIAEALGLKAWQLMWPNLDPSNPPEAPISEEDKAMLTKLRRLLDK